MDTEKDYIEEKLMISGFSEQHIEEQNEIIQATIEATKRALNIVDVVGQSEQLHKLLQYLSDEDEFVGNRTHQEIIDRFNQLG